MKILYLYRTERSDNLKRNVKGQEPDHFLYGFNYLKNKYKQVFFSDDLYIKYKFLHYIFLPLEILLISKTSFGFKLDQAIVLFSSLNRSDLIISTTDSAGLPVLMLKTIKLLNKPVVYISTGLVNELLARKGSFLFNLYKRFLAHADVVICHSQIEADMYKTLIPELRNKIYFIPFGIDINFFKSKNSSHEHILSVGRDRSRDFKLLSQVAAILKKETFILVTSKDNIKGLSFSKNVKIYFDISYKKVKDLYFQSKLVFIPLKELNRASGQVSLLEALAADRKVVMSKVKGIVTSYKDLVERDNNLFLVRSNRAAKVAMIIEKALNKKLVKTNIVKRYNSKRYANELIKIVEIFRNDKKIQNSSR